MRERIVCKGFKKSAFDVGKWNALVRQRIVRESIIQLPDGNPALYCQSCCRAGGLPHGNTKLDRGQQVVGHRIRGKSAPGNEQVLHPVGYQRAIRYMQVGMFQR